MEKDDNWQSSLVTKADRSELPDRRGEPSGEAISLHGKIKLEDFGAKFERTKPEVKEKKTKRKKNLLQDFPKEFIGLNYYPRSKESKEIYSMILHFCHLAIGDISNETLRSGVDEVIGILKHEFQNKKQLVEEILGPLDEESFTQLLNLSKKIFDYSFEKGINEKKDDNLGVSVVFDSGSEDDEDEEENEFEILGEEQEEINGDLDDDFDELVDKNHNEISDFSSLNPRDIDEFWLQRQVAPYYDNPEDQVMICKKIMEILPQDLRECENHLVQLLDFDKFDLIKCLVKNRDLILKKVELPETTVEMDVEEIHDDSPNEDFEAKDFSLFREINLSDLAFPHHFMSSKKCILPEGSFKTIKKHSEEITIPVPPVKNVESDKLVTISSLPDWAQLAFKGTAHTLNRMQSKVFPVAFNTDHNILLCAPTGAGKTNVAMLTILRELSKYKMDDCDSFYTDSFKIIYIAPMKALVQEMVTNFSSRLSIFGIRVEELTGDRQMTKEQIQNTQIIVTTPEKWDIISRKETSYLSLVSLIIIDEIHLLNDERGPVLESIIVRSIRQMENGTSSPVRLVGLSATLPNYKDVAYFLRVKEGLFHFDNTYRPCPLQQQFIGITEKKFKKVALMNQICYEKCLERAGLNQVLIFVHSRKDTAKTAKAIRDMALNEQTIGKFLRQDSSSKQILENEAENAKNSDLKDLLSFGFAIHHAGMKRAERNLVEELFAEGHVQILVSTSTLAWGVNLPAHTVIIKGTQVYSPSKGEWVELSAQDVFQMFGRAGRPQFDTFGEGIIITQQSELQYYISLLNVQLPIESQLISRLPDILNAEIVLGSVKNRDEAAEWLGYTYYYVRMLKAPETYGVSKDEKEKDKYLLKKRLELIHSASLILDKSGLIKYDGRTGKFQSTELGRIASYFYIQHASMKMYNQYLKPNIGYIEIFRIFSQSDEFKQIPTREEEKLEILKLIERVPIPVKESDPNAKINILLQTYISSLKLEGFSLISDMVYVTQSAARLLRCMFEICIRKEWSGLSIKLLNLCKMVEKQMWFSMSPLRQFKTISPDLVRRLEKKEFPWERMFDLGVQELGELIRNPKAGKLIFDHLQDFPRLELKAFFQPITRSMLKIELSIIPKYVTKESHLFWIIVEDGDCEKILYVDTFLLLPRYSTDEHHISFTCPIEEPLAPNYFITAISDRWMNVQTKLPISFKHLILPSKNPAYTELFDMQLQPNNISKEMFPFEYFNAIQTQTFNSFYNGNDNILLAAPVGSGKKVCAELAVLKYLQENEDDKCKIVYICPSENSCEGRFLSWTKKFSRTVVKLTGESSKDLKLMEVGEIIISLPQHWDMMSRRWKQRRNVQAVGLFIVSDLHLIGGSNGVFIEIILSRMRYMASQMDKRIRIICLSCSLANAKDLGEWLGCQVFNFNPTIKFLEINLQGFSIDHVPSLYLAMSKSVNYYLKEAEECIVFVPDPRIAEEICIFISSFYGFPDETVMDIEFEDHKLHSFVSAGICYIHEYMKKQDKYTLIDLWKKRKIKTLVVSRSCCSGLFDETGLEVKTSLVIVMGTQYFLGRDHVYTDYPLADIYQMCGRSTKKVIIMCPMRKKSFYSTFLYQGLPVESHLDHYLHDNFNVEVITKTIENKQEAVDYLTWTWFYRRILSNPNYYNLTGVSHTHLSNHLSELVENTLEDLVQRKCITVDDDDNVKPSNLGMITAYYNVHFVTIEIFSLSLTSTVKLKGLLEILCSAIEFETVEIRKNDDVILKKMYENLPVRMNMKYNDPHAKTCILLQSHFSRLNLPQDLNYDLQNILKGIIPILYAMVDVISSSGWLSPALAAMELCQMVVQALWGDRDSSLKQLPFFDLPRIEKAKENGVMTIFDLIELEDDQRLLILDGLTEGQIESIASVANQYPNVQVEFSLSKEDADEDMEQEDIENKKINVCIGETVYVDIVLSRDDEEVGVVAPFFPVHKDEGWWLLVGSVEGKQICAIKKVTFTKRYEARLEFDAPEIEGSHEFKLMFMCDSWIGCDQEYEFQVVVEKTNA